MPRTVYIEKPENFSFRLTATSHGWYDLPPFEFDELKNSLCYVFRNRSNGKVIHGKITETAGRLRVDLDTVITSRETLVRDVRHILRLDEEMTGFYGALSSHEKLSWVAAKRAGRLLRSPSVFEDLVKTICTTNCSWGLTKKMVVNLVEKLGERSKDGVPAFPSAEAMASVSSDFYRDEIRAGYRSPYFVELAEAVASGKIDPESWLNSELPTSELKKEIKQVKGIGDYAAENLLKLLGRYDGLALDSWLRSQFYKKHNAAKPCSDKKIERYYKKFGEWKGLAIWCDMTEEWFEA